MKSILTGLALVAFVLRLAFLLVQHARERSRRVDHAGSSVPGAEPWHFRKPSDPALGEIAVSSSPERSSLAVKSGDGPFPGERPLLGFVAVFAALTLWGVGALAYRSATAPDFQFGDLLGPAVGLVVAFAALWGVLALSEHLVRIEATPDALTLVTRRGVFFTSRYRYAAAQTWTVSGDLQSVFTRNRSITQKRPFFVLSMKRHVFSSPFTVDVDHASGVWMVEEIADWKRRVAGGSASSS